jgi:hypothetical protein
MKYHYNATAFIVLLLAISTTMANAQFFATVQAQLVRFFSANKHQWVERSLTQKQPHSGYKIAGVLAVPVFGLCAVLRGGN